MTNCSKQRRTPNENNFRKETLANQQTNRPPCVSANRQPHFWFRPHFTETRKFSTHQLLHKPKTTSPESSAASAKGRSPCSRSSRTTFRIIPDAIGQTRLFRLHAFVKGCDGSLLWRNGAAPKTHNGRKRRRGSDEGDGVRRCGGVMHGKWVVDNVVLVTSGAPSVCFLFKSTVMRGKMRLWQRRNGNSKSNKIYYYITALLYNTKEIVTFGRIRKLWISSVLNTCA